MSHRRLSPWLLCAVVALLCFVPWMRTAKCAEPTEEERKAQALVEEVCKDVARIRGLEFKKPVPLVMASREELEKAIRKEMDSQAPPEQLEADARACKVLGLLPADFDYRKEILALYGEQVVGLYDPEGKGMLLGRDQPLKSLTKTLLAHELTHALQDQYYDIGRRMAQSTHTLDEDFAISALVEGDATVVMMDYLAEKGADDPAMLEELAKADETSMKRLRAAPPLLKHMFIDPYFDGMAFVNRFREEGWENIDRIYEDPPLSSEQIMHPRKYYPRRDFPQRIDIAGLPAPLPGARRCDTTLGEIGVLSLVESWGQLLKDEDLGKSAGTVAAGWDGDRLVDVEDGRGGFTLYWISTWDTPQDATEMLEALRKWTDAWPAGETDAKARRRVLVIRPDIDAKPSTDVICVMSRTTGQPPDVPLAAPAYTKTVVRSVRDLKAPGPDASKAPNAASEKH